MKKTATDRAIAKLLAQRDAIDLAIIALRNAAESSEKKPARAELKRAAKSTSVFAPPAKVEP